MPGEFLKLLFCALFFIMIVDKTLSFIDEVLSSVDSQWRYSKMPIILVEKKSTQMQQASFSCTNEVPKTRFPFLRFSWWFDRKPDYYEGVPRINIYLLKLLFTLMFVFLTYEAWSHILSHEGPWNNANAAAWCMWGSYSAIAFIGIRYPLKMLPIVLFEIVYKTAWLFIVAYPLWRQGALAGTAAGKMANVFIWVFFPIVAMPWKYLFKNYIRW